MPNDIRIGMTLDDGGTIANKDKEAKKFKKSLQEAAEVASTIRVPTATSAAQQGVANANASRAPVSAGYKATTKASTNTASDTNLSRAVGGDTGAEGRDFAKQARGLGGLVHVYATFAANLFAVSAAFTALKAAADTTNMIKGLDQLGAASGRGLGALSKQLVEITGGAITLRDAMTSVAQASAAGLGNKQIQDLAVVAAKASNALGIGMTDAISRLSRGISKIEPELLDELGIFVKVDQATQKYALSIGKSAASLSDFEKRQAFANAVLEQGKEKFAAIDAAANPFDKLLASMSNMATVGLQLVNTVLGPIAKMLADSPTGLAIAMAAIVGVLLKQAIPALGMMKETAASAAAEAGKLAQAKVDIVKKGYEESALGVKAAANKEAKIALDTAIKNADEIANAKSEVMGKYEEKRIAKYAEQTGAAGRIMRKDLEDITSKDLKSLENTAKGLETRAINAAQAASTGKASGDTKDQIAANEKLAKSYMASANAHRGYITVIEDAQKGHAAFNKAEKEAIATSIEAQKQHEVAAKAYVDEEIKKQGALSTATQNQVIANRALVAAKSSDIIATAAQTASTKGFLTAIREANAAIKLAQGDMGPIQGPKMGPLIGSWTLLKAGISGATSAISTFLNFAGPWLQLIGLAIAAFGVLDNIMSKASKQQDEFNSKVTESDSAVKTVNDTFDLYITKKKGAFSIEGISAFSTSLRGVSDALTSQVLAFDKIKEVAGDWDKFKDSLAGVLFFTDSNIQKLQKNTVEGVKAAVKSLELSGKSTEAKGIIAKALFGKDGNIDKLMGSTKELNKAFDGLTETQREAKIAKIADAIALVTKNEEYSTNALKAFAESLTSIDKLVDQMIQANAFTDLQGKLGVELVVAAERFAQALSNPLSALQALAKIGQNPKMLAALGVEDLDNLKEAAKYTRDLNEALKQRAEAASYLEKAKAGEGDLVKSLANRSILSGSTSIFKLQGEKEAAKLIDIKAAENDFKRLDSALSNLKTKAADFASGQMDMVTKIADKGFEKIEIGLKRAKESAQLSIEKSASSIAASAGANTADTDYGIKIKELNIQSSLIDANYAVQMATITNSQRLEELTNSLDIANARVLLTSTKVEERDVGKIMMEGALRTKDTIDASKLLKEGGSKVVPYTEQTLAAARSRNAQLTIPSKVRASAQSGIEAGRVIAGKERGASKEAETLKNLEQQSALEKQVLATKTEYLNIAASLAPYASDALIDAKASVSIETLRIDQDLQLAAIAKDRANIDANATDDEKKRLKGIFDSKAENIKADGVAKTTAIEFNSIKDKGAAAQAKTSAASAIELQNLQSGNSVKEAQIGLDQNRLDILVQLNQIDELSASRAKTQNEQKLLSLKYIIEEARLVADIAQKQKALDLAKAAETEAKKLPVTAASAIALGQATTGVTEATAQLAASEAAKTAGAAVNDITKQGIGLQQALNEKLIAQKAHLADLASLTESLGVAFGNTGSSIGNAVSSLDSLNKNQADRTEELKNTKLQGKEYSDLVSRSNRAELTDQAKLLGATKKIFSEKTFAFKALDKAEKAMHIWKIGSMVVEQSMAAVKFLKDMFFTQTKTTAVITGAGIETGAVLAGEAATLPAKTAGATASLFSSSGILAFGLVGVMLALIGAGSGKGSSAIPAGMTSADRQETQGTGQSWVNGQKVDTGGGVFGDNTAKNESIVKSLEILSNVGIEGLDYNKKMLKAMQKVALAVTGVATSIYQIPGVRVGSGFGTTEGTSGGSFLGWGSSTSTNIQDAGVVISGAFSDLADASKSAVRQYETVLRVTQSSSWFGLSKSSSSSISTTEKPLEDPKLKKAFADIFSNATDMFITIGETAGITETTIRDTLASLPITLSTSLKGLTGPQMEAELNSTVGKALSTASEKLFSGIFENFNTFGEDYLTTVTRVVDANNKVDQALRSIGSTFNVLGNFNISDTMIKAAGSLEIFMDQASFFRDTFLTDAERLVPVQKSVNDQLTKLGISTSITRDEFKNLVLAQVRGTIAGDELYQSLMELAPGFDAVTSAISSAAEATQSLQIELLNAQGKTNAALLITRAKVLSTMTTEDAAIQTQIDLQEDANKTRSLSNTLLTLEGNVTKVTADARTEELAAMSFADAAIQQRIYLLQDEAKLGTIRQKIYTALGSTEEALAITRSNELKTIDDSLKPYQMYLYALEDENSLKAKLTTAYNTQSTAIKGTITSLSASIKTLTDYRKTLTAGASSILTPTEKYAQAKSELAQTAQAAQAIITETSTAEQIAARDTAISQLSSTSETFLNASRDMYASGAQYTADYKSVLDTLDNSTANLTTQKSTAEKQLDALDSSVSFLTSIDASTATVASLLTQYYAQQGITSAAKALIPGLASGGIGNGITLVGEKGPEVVDFINPGRVYSNQATNDLFNTKELVAEIRSLRAEVSQLRADQKEQTGHLISTNYDANNRNADSIANANDEALKQQDWKVRSQVKIA